MFCGAEVFHQDLSIWNVSNVTEMSEMFQEAVAFNGNISRCWDISNVLTDMGWMVFVDAKVF
jgi:surface protein